jgi:saccharopine dehydrogenase (NAD+, L-lysine forming)
MSEQVRLWVRHETRPTERRAPIVPADAGRLIAHGYRMTVEESPQRVFPETAYAAVGCRIVPAGSWVTAGPDEVVVGVKELPGEPAALTQRHVYFGHAYKGQDGAADLLRRFAAGGGTLLDAEYLVDDSGRRLAAFGYWAGYVGAALAVLRWRGRLPVPLAPLSKAELDARLRPEPGEVAPRVLVVGALGRGGRGARAALDTAGVTPTCWDLAETRDLDRAALLDHDILVNTVLSTDPSTRFLASADLDAPRRLSVVSDVTCDVTSACNVLPIYDRVTTWDSPVLTVGGGRSTLDVIAIDNLPSLLPGEASVAFSGELTDLLMLLRDDAPVWRRCREFFGAALRSTGVAREAAHA